MATVQDYLNNKKWLHRQDQLFEQLDQNKDGFLMRKNFLETVDRLDKAIPDRKQFIAKAREATEEWLDVFGLVEGMKVDKLKYREMSAAFSLIQAEQFKKKELTVEEKSDHALFDVVDRNSNGYLSWDEYKELMTALDEKMTDEAIQAAFDLLDTDKNGKLDKNEFAAADVKFWCVPEDSSSDGLFGPEY